MTNSLIARATRATRATRAKAVALCAAACLRRVASRAGQPVAVGAQRAPAAAEAGQP